MSYKISRDLLDYSDCSKINPPTDNNIKLPVIRQRPPETYIEPQPVQSTLQLDLVEENYANSGSPEVWGPFFWFSLHNGALRYPVNASPTWRERMKNFIIGIPVMIPCEKCYTHATSYIEKHYEELDSVVSGRDVLFKFYCDFHNYVNKRLHKPIMSQEDALKMYSSPVKVTKLKSRLV